MRETILEIGRDLAVGQSIMAECVECGERKMSVTRYADGLGHVCFRATCNARGAITEGVPAFRRDTNRNQNGFVPRPYDLNTQYPFPGSYAQELLDRIPDGLYSHGVMAAGPNVALFNLAGLDGRVRGWQTRGRSKGISSGKMLPGPLYGWYESCGEARSVDAVWIVEDPLSAIRLCEAGAWALTILGTRLDVAILDELWDAYPNCRRVYVALDPGAEDAAREAVRLCRMERGLDAIQVPLPDDIHRLDQDTLTRLLEAYP